MTKDEALKLAREALVLNNAEWKALADSGDAGFWEAEEQDHYKQTEQAITAIQEHLAQLEQEQLMSDQINYGMSVTQGGKRIDPMSIYKEPEQKPVALETVYETIIQWDEGGGKRSRRELARRIVSLYTTPPQRKPLTDEEIEDIWADCPADWDDKINVLTLARAIEAAHGIKGEA